MSRKDNEVRVTPSVLDRLLDFEPRNQNEAPKSKSRSVAELKQSVRRDLEWLLNSRSYHTEIDEKSEEIKKSVVTYGLPDFTGMSVRNRHDMNKLRKAVEDAIKRFEPRFLDVKLVVDEPDNKDRMIRFRIEAFLNMEPAPEPITFDTVLELGSGDFVVK
ncbi:MAG: type VI secretion system baseplate subunit TssE [Acidobacteriota bacterium]|nr:type VI secretion system baseplate subunit TssE [Acidobacteriota bacterium]MDH3531234.1 type VI secretion system baseplate subunit TssE [Acidobacteriota bacterium]